MKYVTWILIIAIVAFAGYFFFMRDSNTADLENDLGATAGLVGANDTISVSDQSSGDSIVVDSAWLGQGGYIAVHADADGAPGSVIGVSDLLVAGNNTGVSVALDRASQSGEALYAVVHVDNGDGIFNASEDAPTMNANGALVMMQFVVE